MTWQMQISKNTFTLTLFYFHSTNTRYLMLLFFFFSKHQIHFLVGFSSFSVPHVCNTASALYIVYILLECSSFYFICDYYYYYLFLLNPERQSLLESNSSFVCTNLVNKVDSHSFLHFRPAAHSTKVGGVKFLPRCHVAIPSHNT